VDHDNHGWIWIPWAFFQSCLRAAFCHLISSSENIVHGLLETPVSNPFFVCVFWLALLSTFSKRGSHGISIDPMIRKSKTALWPRMWQKLNTLVLNLDINLCRLLEADELVCGEVMISDQYHTYCCCSSGPGWTCVWIVAVFWTALLLLLLGCFLVLFSLFFLGLGFFFFHACQLVAVSTHHVVR